MRRRSFIAGLAAMPLAGHLPASPASAADLVHCAETIATFRGELDLYHRGVMRLFEAIADKALAMAKDGTFEAAFGR